jgi:hypothetical protein
MIGQLGNFINFRVAPFLTLTAFFLILFVFLSPVRTFQTSLPLVVIKPSLLLVPVPADGSIDGIAIFLGALGESVGHT